MARQRHGAAETRDGVELTSLDGPLFDAAGHTKRDLVDYLDAVRHAILPAVAGRALSVVRVRPGQQPFMQKNLPKYPDWIARTTVWAEASHREIAYPSATTAARRCGWPTSAPSSTTLLIRPGSSTPRTWCSTSTHRRVTISSTSSGRRC